MVRKNETNDNLSNKKINKYKFNVAEVIVIMAITLMFGIIVGSLGTIAREKVDVFHFDKNANELVSVYEDIVDNYYKDIEKEELVEAGIKGMLSSLEDPYYSFVKGQEAKDSAETLTGEYVGLGVEITLEENGTFKVVEVYKDSPAYKCGIEVGDILTKVEGVSVEGETLESIPRLIKGKKGTKGHITILREGEEIEKTFTREIVDLLSVKGEIINSEKGNIAYINISNFAQNTSSQFKESYYELKNENPKYMVLDLRDNTGGYLSSLRDILSMFLDKGQVMYYTGNNEAQKKYESKTKKEIDVPVVVLINGGSASASEVFAASLKHNLDALLVGNKTYGKGTIQKTTTLENGSSFKYTIEKWWTPEKTNVDQIGITPDYEINQIDEYYQNPSNITDNQLQEAIKLLLSETNVN